MLLLLIPKQSDEIGGLHVYLFICRNAFLLLTINHQVKLFLNNGNKHKPVNSLHI